MEAGCGKRRHLACHQAQLIFEMKLVGQIHRPTPKTSRANVAGMERLGFFIAFLEELNIYSCLWTYILT